MDLLTEVLRDVRLGSTFFCRSELSAPWGIDAPAGESAIFHFLVRGNALLEVQGEERPLVLSGGDLTLLPQGNGHALRDASGSPAISLAQLLASHDGHDRIGLRHGGGGRESTLLCGALTFDDRRTNPVLSALPPVIHVPGERGRAVPWLETQMACLACEASSDRPGAPMVMARLAEVVFFLAVRAYVDALPEGSGGWLRSLKDPRIGRALALLHHAPGEGWTLDRLAGAAAMSRSRFAARFHEVVGEPPLQYLTRWRMHRATTLLRDTQHSLAEIAGRIGYEPEASFSTAFRRFIGTPPATYRRQRRRGTDLGVPPALPSAEELSA